MIDQRLVPLAASPAGDLRPGCGGSRSPCRSVEQRPCRGRGRARESRKALLQQGLGHQELRHRGPGPPHRPVAGHCHWAGCRSAGSREALARFGPSRRSVSSRQVPERAEDMPSADTPLIIDVEASGFGGASYPIEIGCGPRRRAQVLRPDPARARVDALGCRGGTDPPHPAGPPGDLRQARARRRPDPERAAREPNGLHGWLGGRQALADHPVRCRPRCRCTFTTARRSWADYSCPRRRWPAGATAGRTRPGPAGLRHRASHGLDRPGRPPKQSPACRARTMPVDELLE